MTRTREAERRTPGVNDEQRHHADDLQGLTLMLCDSDPGFSLYKRHHWNAVVRDVIGPWLSVHDENLRASMQDPGHGLSPEPVRTECRAVYPVTLTEDSILETRVLPEEDAQGLVDFINGRLSAAGLPPSAHLETRELYANEWSAR